MASPWDTVWYCQSTSYCLDISKHRLPPAEPEGSLNHMPEPNLCLRDINAYYMYGLMGNNCLACSALKTTESTY
jgi:hypothetical protein